jgi:hypothetical protein
VLHRAYETYTGQLVSTVEFSDLMTAAGFKKKTSGGKVYWHAIGLVIPSPGEKGE